MLQHQIFFAIPYILLYMLEGDIKHNLELFTNTHIIELFFGETVLQCMVVKLQRIDPLQELGCFWCPLAWCF